MVRVHTKKPEHSSICPSTARKRLGAEGTLPALRPKDRPPLWHPCRPETAPGSSSGPRDEWGQVPAPRGPRAPSLSKGTHTQWSEALASCGLCAPQRVIASVLPYVKWGPWRNLPCVTLLESNGTWLWEMLSQGSLLLWYTVVEGHRRFWNTGRREC